MADRAEYQKAKALFQRVFPEEPKDFSPHEDFFAKQELWWKRGLEGKLEIISDGKPVENARQHAAAKVSATLTAIGCSKGAAALQRIFLYHRKEAVFVDIERFGGGLLVSRGVENRWMDFPLEVRPSNDPVADARALVTYYVALNFEETGGFHYRDRGIVVREFRKQHGPEKKLGVLDEVFLNDDKAEQATTHAEAIAKFEAKVAALRRQGYVMTLAEIESSYTPRKEIPAAASDDSDSLEIPDHPAPAGTSQSRGKTAETTLDLQKEEFAKVIREFGLKAMVSEAGFSAKGPCLIHRGDVTMNWLSFLKIVPQGVETVVIAGNLIVNGTISQDMEGRNGHVIVTGNASATDLWSTGNGFLLVKGDLDLRYYAYGEYNDGATYVGGVTRVPYVFNNDHCLCLHATVDGIDVCNRDAELEEELAPECFDRGEFSMFNTGKLIEKGRSPFKKGKKG